MVVCFQTDYSVDSAGSVETKRKFQLKVTHSGFRQFFKHRQVMLDEFCSNSRSEQKIYMGSDFCLALYKDYFLILHL